MTHRTVLVWASSLVALGLLAGAGCQKARKYGSSKSGSAADTEKKSAGPEKSRKKKEAKKPPPKEEKPAPLPPDYAWILPEADEETPVEPEVPIFFVSEKGEPEKWNKLTQFWTRVLKKPATPLGKARYEIRIKVPLGLDDPTPEHIPLANPPTVGKWALGKRLFFDDSYLWPAKLDRNSCATCHDPRKGFTNGQANLVADRMRVLPLPNVVYNNYLFWDGRVSALEEVVQRSLEDEREPTPPTAEKPRAEAERRHVWSGVVKRLRANKDYLERFKKVFGTPPTQDNIGKALATYLRTILVGNSLYDRARKTAGEETPEQGDYAKVLDKVALKALHREAQTKDKVAKELHAGYLLFNTQFRCARCHNEPTFTDNDFHNVGVRESGVEPKPGQETGRFARVPVGLKDRRLLGAFKTPTLRALPQTGPYFHDGSGKADKEAREGSDTHDLTFTVMQHVKLFRSSPFLEPEFHTLELPEKEVRTLVLFLRALDGRVDPVVSDPAKQPEGVVAAKP